MADTKRLKRVWVPIGVAIAAILAASVAATVVSAQNSSECSPFEGSIKESEAFTPVEGRMTQPRDPVITSYGSSDPAMDPQASVDAIHGKPRRWAAANGGSAYQYFLDSEVTSDMTLSEFFSAGGIQLDQDPAEPGEAFAAETLKNLGERAVAVQIGDYDAALVWADPEVSNTRLHHLYWSDGKVNYGLYADVSAEQMVNLGREFVCR